MTDWPTYERAAALHAKGDNAAAASLCIEALAGDPDDVNTLHLLGLVRFAQGAPADALTLLRRAVALQPDFAAARVNLGNMLAMGGDVPAALAEYEAATARRPDNVEALRRQGCTLALLGRGGEAETCLRRVLDLRADDVEALMVLGNVVQLRGDRDEAKRLWQRAVAIKPESAEALHGLGLALQANGEAEAAIAVYERALARRPDYVEALSNLGLALRGTGRLAEAAERCRRAVDLRPDFVEGHVNLGVTLQDLGRHDDAVAAFRQALAVAPDHAAAHSNLIFALDLLPGSGFEAQQAERRRWHAAHARPLAAAVRPHANDRDPERRLRVGYVSADFKRHSAAYSFGPVLRRHDRGRFAVVCYSGVVTDDDLTREFRAGAESWRSTVGLSDEALAAAVREDRIDILVDLAGHSAGNRLLAFARKPAPVQVTAWGQATGTGLPTIDYLFSDRVAVPSGVRHLFAETVYDLPCLLTFEAAGYAPDVAPPPALGARAITFGCLNRLAKVTEPALALWARILRAVPGSRLLLKDYGLNDAAAGGRLLDALRRHGVGAERVVLRGGSPHAEHLAAFREVDIALDPFPQNGGISTYEALWMGVPAVARLGDSVPGRVSAAILTALGLDDWVAADDDAYVDIAVARAGDPQALAALRADLRRRVAAAPAADPARYTRAVEDAYRDMWRRWCAANA